MSGTNAYIGLPTSQMQPPSARNNVLISKLCVNSVNLQCEHKIFEQVVPI